MAINTVGIVGGGLMGGGIAEVCAKAGVSVTVVEMDEALADRSRSATKRSLDKAVDRGKLDQSLRDSALGFLSYSTNLSDLSDADLVIEAIVEDAAIKQELFGKLDEIVTSQDAVLASNTSSIPITQIGSATSRPEAVVGMHFFNPAPIMPLVEIISTVVVEQRFIDAAADFAGETLGKTVVHAGDRAGFIVNKLLCPYLFESIRMYEEGFATKEDIDAAMVNGAGYPMGPLTLSDLIGNDTLLAVADAFMAEYNDVRYAAPPLLRRMVEAGLLGRKSGRGFYDYS